MKSDGATRTRLDSGTTQKRRRNFRLVLVMTFIGTCLGLVSIGPSPLITPSTSGQASRCVPPPAGLVSWWPADGNATDIMPSPDNGTLNDGAAFAPGQVANAFSLNGTTAYVSAPDALKLNFGTGDFSIDAWIKTSNANGVQTIVDKRVGDNATGFTGYSLFTFNGRLGVQLADGMASNFVSAMNVADGLFHHVAVTVVRNSATGGNLYVGGVSVLTFNPTGRPSSLTNTAELRIGRNSPDTILSGIFKGLIDEVELFSRALTAAEVQSVFDAGPAGKCKCIITCPGNIDAVATASRPIGTGASASFTVSASDNCPAAIISCSPASGSVFPLGTTTVTCRATDTSGSTATCRFTVTAFSFFLPDDSNQSNMVLVNAVTGDFSFRSGGVIIAGGRGTLQRRGSIGSIDASQGNRRVHIQWDTSANGVGAGTAYVRNLPNNDVSMITARSINGPKKNICVPCGNEGKCCVYGLCCASCDDPRCIAGR